jgi:hypothetical protein
MREAWRLLGERLELLARSENNVILLKQQICECSYQSSMLAQNQFLKPKILS